MFNTEAEMENSNAPIIMHLDDALESSPIGLFQYRILLMCGFAFMADALEVNLLSFLSTCAGDEWNLSNTQKASITGVVFGGIIIGSLFWGAFADRYGRKLTFVIVSAIITIGGFLTGAASSFPILLFIRAVVGFGIGGASIPFDLLAEFLPASHRGSFLIYIEYFWTIGSVFVTGLAWLFLDKYGWRVLSILTAIPVAITSIFSIFYLPESPRWLLSVGKSTEAEKVIKKAAAVNGYSMHPFSLICDTAVNDGDYFDLIRKKHLRNITLPLWLVWAIFGLTYYGIILFVSRIYAKANDDDSNNKCSFDYSSIFINSLAELGGVTISAFFLDRFGRIKMQIVFYFISGIAVFLMGFESSPVSILVTSIIGRMAVMAASVSYVLLS